MQMEFNQTRVPNKQPMTPARSNIAGDFYKRGVTIGLRSTMMTVRARLSVKKVGLAA